MDQQRKCPGCDETLIDGDFIIKYDVNRAKSLGDIQVSSQQILYIRITSVSDVCIFIPGFTYKTMQSHFNLLCSQNKFWKKIKKSVIRLQQHKMNKLFLWKRNDYNCSLLSVFHVFYCSLWFSSLQIVNGYFVHFFAPPDLPRVPKNVVFVIDRSGSMSGTKIQQVRDCSDIRHDSKVKWF